MVSCLDKTQDVAKRLPFPRESEERRGVCEWERCRGEED